MEWLVSYELTSVYLYLLKRGILSIHLRFYLFAERLQLAYVYPFILAPSFLVLYQHVGQYPKY